PSVNTGRHPAYSALAEFDGCGESSVPHSSVNTGAPKAGTILYLRETENPVAHNSIFRKRKCCYVTHGLVLSEKVHCGMQRFEKGLYCLGSCQMRHELNLVFRLPFLGLAMSYALQSRSCALRARSMVDGLTSSCSN